ncbi:MAG: type 2 isopentenyl-diphosphate Delta-isomerase [Spirochaetales bacterium]|nr:type 2 isopentenyl-diphosphate Delta-isomerase [Spirochaetales bacterium]
MDTGNMTSKAEENLAKRKARHHEICLDESLSIEGTRRDLDMLRFIHQADPGLHAEKISTQLSFLGYTCRLPFFISCMTGGSVEGFRANKNLAQAAEEAGIPVGTGSIRILHSQPDLLEHFQLKKLAPNVPVLANLSMVQLKELSHKWIYETLDVLEVDALVLHLNPGQEMFQKQGDRDFSHLLKHFSDFAQSKKLPLIIKETGFGISPVLAKKYLEAGADFIDLAGRGGSNWILIEDIREPLDDFSKAENFRDWGNDLCASLMALQNQEGRILASGGIRSGMDIAKSIALGAKMAGLALPFIRAEKEGQKKAILDLISQLERELKIVMVLSGSKDIDSLGRAALMIDPSLADSARQLANNGDWRNSGLISSL